MQRYSLHPSSSGPPKSSAVRFCVWSDVPVAPSNKSTRSARCAWKSLFMIAVSKGLPREAGDLSLHGVLQGRILCCERKTVCTTNGLPREAGDLSLHGAL